MQNQVLLGNFSIYAAVKAPGVDEDKKRIKLLDYNINI